MLAYEQCYKSNGVCLATVSNTVDGYAEKGIEYLTSLKRNVNSNNSRHKVGDCAEAHIIELACSPAPEDHSSWNLRLLEDECKVILDDSVGKDAIASTLKNKLRHHRSTYWCIFEKDYPEFIAAMEEVLAVYVLPYDPARPIICMDESLYQLLGNEREPLPIRPGDTQKIDSEYACNGTCSIFALIGQFGGKHHVSVR